MARRRRRRKRKTLVVGDSLGVGTLPHIRGAAGDVREGRGSQEALAVLLERLAPRHDSVVFDVGTNDPSARTLRRSVRQADRATGDRPLFLATVNGPQAKRKNRALRQYARKHDDVELVPWARRGSTGGDGIHADAAGYEQRGRMFNQAIRGEGSGGGPRRRRAKKPLPNVNYAEEVQRAYRKYGVLPAHLLGLIDIESGGDPNAVSYAGARGLTQFMPGTAPSYNVQYGDSPKAIRSQINGAARYLIDLGYKRGDRAAIRLALASYNAGPGNPSAAGDYPEKVLAAARAYEGSFKGVGRSGGGGGRSKGRRTPGSTVDIPIPGEMRFDEKGYEEASKRQLLAEFIADDAPSILDELTAGRAKTPEIEGLDVGLGEGSSLFRTGLLSTDPVSRADFQQLGPDRALTVHTPGARRGGGGRNGGRAARAGRGGKTSGKLANFKIKPDGNKGAKQLAEWATRGVYGSGERSPAENAAVGGADDSDHLTTKTDASAVDFEYGKSRMVARRLGLGKRWRPGTYDRHIIEVDGRTYSVQILEDVEGHYDHGHLGIQRV